MLPLFCTLGWTNTTIVYPEGFWRIWPPSCEATRRCEVLDDFVVAEPAACGAAALYLWVAYTIWRSVKYYRCYTAVSALMLLWLSSVCYHISPVVGFYVLQLVGRRVLQLNLTWLTYASARPVLQTYNHCLLRVITAARLFQVFFIVSGLVAMVEMGLSMEGYLPEVSEILALVVDLVLFGFCMVFFLARLKDQWLENRSKWLIVSLLWFASIVSRIQIDCVPSLFAEAQQHVFTAALASYAIPWCAALYRATLDQYAEEIEYPDLSHEEKKEDKFDERECCSGVFLPATSDGSKPYWDQTRSFVGRVDSIFQIPHKKGDIGICLIWGYVVSLMSLFTGTPLEYASASWVVIFPGMCGMMMTQTLAPHWFIVGYLLPSWLPMDQLAISMSLLLMFTLFWSWWRRDCQAAAKTFAFFICPGPCWSNTESDNNGSNHNNKTEPSFLTASLLGLPTAPSSSSSSSVPRVVGFNAPRMSTSETVLSVSSV